MSIDEMFTTEIEPSPCTIEFTGSHVVVRGELDMSNEPELAAAFETARRPEGAVVVDMSGVSFIDSSALRALVRFHTAGEGLVVRHPSAPVSRLLQLTKLDEVLTVELPAPR